MQVVSDRIFQLSMQASRSSHKKKETKKENGGRLIEKKNLNNQ